MTQGNDFENFKNLRKLKDFDTERSHSAGNNNQERKNEGYPILRTRSVSPMPLPTPLAVKLPLKKFYNIYSKMITQLETLKSLAENKSNLTDTLLDLRRQLQRADEFSIRFSRNNLYETKRIFNEIKKLLVAYPFHKLNSNECKFLCKKIILGYQAASQSLQIYINYVKNPANLELPEKINELVLLIADLFLCCEHLSLPTNEVFIQNDAVKICNELISILKSKLSIGEYVVIKQEDLSKKKPKHMPEGENIFRSFSMYKSKPSTKLKSEVAPKKKLGVSCLLGNKSRKVKKRDERKARITHEIYTQKLNPRHAKNPWNKPLKFESFRGTAEFEKSDGSFDKKQLLKKQKFFTPREVKSQDDDIETMVQTIEDDEIMSSRLYPTLEETEEESDASNSLNKSSFRELLLEAVQELQTTDKKEHKATLKKLLRSIQNCSKNQYSSPRSSKVKLFCFKSKDLEEEDKKLKICEKKENIQSSLKACTNILSTEQEVGNSVPILGRCLNTKFKPIQEKKDEKVERRKIQLKLPQTSIETFNKYKKLFIDYTNNNIMYKKTLTTRPWELVEKIADRILLDIIKKITADFENDAMLKRLYLNEFVEVIK